MFLVLGNVAVDETMAVGSMSEVYPEFQKFIASK